MANFGQLKAQIARDLVRDDLSSDTNASLTDDTISYYVKSVIKKYTDSERLWFLQEIGTFSTVASTRSYSLSTNFSDFVDDKSAKITDTNYDYKLEKRNYDFMETNYPDTYFTGRPDFYALQGDNIVLGPVPDQAYTITLTYFKELPELSADSDTNDWTTTCERLIRFKTIADIFTLVLQTPELAAPYEMLAREELITIRGLNNRRSGGGKLKVRYI